MAPTAFAASIASIWIVRAQPIQNTDLTSGQKARLRTEAALARKEAWLKFGTRAAFAVAERGLALIETLKALPLIAGYHPFRHELNTLPLLGALHSKGFHIALPRMEKGPALSFRQWCPDSTLEKGRLGVREPQETEPVINPAVILVPLLAFDRKGNRLGYGAGYYDASLRGLRSGRSVVAIGIGFDEQEFPEVPREPQDETLDMILTPSRVIACGG